MSGKCRPSLRKKTLANVMRSPLSVTDKECVKAVFERFEGMVKVVRCKDCKHYKQNPWNTEEEELLCQCFGDWLPTEPDDFCSYGERKEE